MGMYVVEHTRIEMKKAPASGDDRGFSQRVSVITTSHNDTDAATVDAANHYNSYPVVGDNTSSLVRPYRLPPQQKQQVGHTPDHRIILRDSAFRDTGE